MTEETKKPLVVLSLGAGVQSSTLALMAAHGEITPMPDHAIFADTGAEPAGVYRWLDWLEKQLPYPVHRVNNGSLMEESLTLRQSKDGQGSYVRNVVPAFTQNPDGSTGMLLRKCTSDFKIVPIERKIRELIGLKKGQRGPKHVAVECWQGISLDEIQRARRGLEGWQQFRYPLIEKRMDRNACLRWMADHDYPMPSKSACTFCPYHSDEQWRDIKLNDPDGFAQAVDFERRWNEVVLTDKRPSQTKGVIRLHRSLVPLDQVDFRNAADMGQMDAFADECEGMCGI